MAMKMNLLKLVQDQHGAAATRFLGDLLEQSPDKLKGNIDSSFDTVLDGFSSVAGEQSGRELLYEAIRYSDDAVVEDPAFLFRDRDSRDVFVEANNRLSGLVGVANKDQMIEKLRSRTDLSAPDAENMLGYVTPGVLGVLKRQIGNGQVLDNPDGIGQLFLGEGDIGNVDTSKRPISGGSAPAAAATAHDDGADMSWLVRYAMPAVLLGGLVLGGLNNCGNRAEQRIVADQRATLQMELDAVRQEAEQAQGQIVALQSNYDTAQTQATELTSRTETLTTELDSANGRIGELEEALNGATTQGDAARAEVQELGAQTETLTMELDTARARVTELQSGLDDALAAGDAAKSELETANATIESAEAELAELNTRASTLTADLEAARTRVSGLEGELDTTRAETSALRGQVESVTAELNQVKDVPVETSALQGLLSDVTAERNASVDANAVIKGKLQTAINERDFAKGKVVQLESELGKAVGEIASKNEELKQIDILSNELASVTAVRDEAVERNGQFEAANAELQQQVEAGTRQVNDLESRLRTSTERLAALDTKFTETSLMLDQEKSSREADVSRLTTESVDLQDRLSEMLGLRDQAVNSLAMRESEVTSLGEKVNSLQAEIETLEEANASAKAEAQALQQQIEALNGDLESTQQKVTETSATLAEREQSLASVNADLDTANQELASVTTERDELLNKRDALALRVKELMTEKDQVVAETVELKGTIDSLNGELTAAKQSGADSESKLGLLNESMGGLQKELRLITGARDEASNQARNFRTEAGELKKQVAKLEGDLTAAQTAHDEGMKAMQAEHDEAMKAMQSESEQMNGKILTLTDQLNATGADLQKATDDLAALNAEKAAAMADIEALQQQGATLQSSLETETGKVADLESSVAMLEEDVASLTGARDNANEQIRVLSEEVETLKGALDDEQSNVMKLTDSISSLQSDNSGITSERDDALGKIQMLEAELAKSVEQATSLEGTRNQLQMQVDDAAARAQARIDSTLAVRDSIAGQLAEAGISSASVSSIENDSAVAVTLGSGDLYDIGSATLSPGGNDLLAGVGQIIAGYPQWRVDVEGHTDSQGIGAVLREKYPTNWELSTARASAAVRYLSSRAGIDAEMISARGYGETRPVASNETSAGREQNRRVEIILRQ